MTKRAEKQIDAAVENLKQVADCLRTIYLELYDCRMQRNAVRAELNARHAAAAPNGSTLSEDPLEARLAALMQRYQMLYHELDCEEMAFLECKGKFPAIIRSIPSRTLMK